MNSGAEAVENAVKIARAHTGRSGIIAFEDAFHGRTMMTLALTSKTHPYKAGFAPFPGDVYRIPYAYCYRCSYSLKYPSCDLFCARHLEDTFKRVVASEDVAAVIAEPVLGEGGFVVPPPDFFRVLIDICHKHGVLFHRRRSAKRLRTNRAHCLPASTTASSRILSSPPNRSAEVCRWPPSPAAPKSWTRPAPAVSAARLLAIRFPAPPRWRCSTSSSAKNFSLAPTRSEDISEARERMAEALADYRRCSRPRRAMQAIELVKSRREREPAADETKEITQYCYEHGLITITAGSYSNVIRVLVPLVVTDEQMDEALDVLESALHAVSEKRGAVSVSMTT